MLFYDDGCINIIDDDCSQRCSCKQPPQVKLDPTTRLGATCAQCGGRLIESVVASPFPGQPPCGC